MGVYPVIDARLMRRIATYFKYVSDDEKVLSGIFKHGKIRFTQPAALNDPIEYRPDIDFGEENAHSRTRYQYEGELIPSFKDLVEIQNIHRFYNQFGVLSLTKQPFNYGMWCQYANGHKGIVIELNRDFLKHPCFLYKDRAPLKIYKVCYVDNYKLDFEKLECNGIEMRFDDLLEQLMVNKIRFWKYEKEYRVVRRLSECPQYTPPPENKPHIDTNVYLFDFNLECVESVIFGTNTSRETKESILSACEGSDVKFFQAILVHDKGVKMGFIRLEHFTSREQYLEIKPQLFINGVNDLCNWDVKNITTLQDIPYYPLAKFQIDSYLENKRRRKGVSA